MMGKRGATVMGAITLFLGSFVGAPAPTKAAQSTTLLTSGARGLNAVTYSSAPITPPANTLLVAYVASVAKGYRAAAVPSLSGNGLTWNRVGTKRHNYIRRLSTYVAMSSSPSSGPVSFGFGSQAQRRVAWSVFAISDSVGTVANNGVDGVRQVTATRGVGTSGRAVLPGSPQSPTSRVVAGFAHADNKGTTPRAGWIELHDANSATEALTLETEWRPDVFERAASARWQSSTAWQGIALELLGRDEPPVVAPVVGVPAFPAAQGFGTETPGGRGGIVCEVTNLNDSGAGSLRTCLTATGPRTVVFRTGGTIEVNSQIVVTNPYLTIAGQTAPGGGITLKADPGILKGPLAIRTHDVIVRFLRLRPGPSNSLSEARRGLVISDGSYNVVVDHSSITWATDENVTVIDGAHDITFSHNIISEGLSNSTHPEGEHSKGLIISGKNYSSTEQTKNVSIHHNLFAHNRERNPLNSSYGLADVVNNVIYNAGDKLTSVSDVHATVPINFVSNFVKAGVDSSSAYELVAHQSDTGLGAQLYVNGNIGPHRTDDTQPEEYVVGPYYRGFIVATRFAAPTVTTTSAIQAYADVVAEAGVRVPVLDTVDERIISDVLSGTGRIIDDPSQVGGWPALAAGVPPIDGDRDGIPNTWETAHALDPNSAADSPQMAANGYTNLENYLNELVGDAMAP
jgi:pectate lyase